MEQQSRTSATNTVENTLVVLNRGTAVLRSGNDNMCTAREKAFQKLDANGPFSNAS